MTRQIDSELPVENADYEAETRALEHFDRGLGMNFDAGFGSLLFDTGAADFDRTLREHRIIEE